MSNKFDPSDLAIPAPEESDLTRVRRLQADLVEQVRYGGIGHAAMGGEHHDAFNRWRREYQDEWINKGWLVDVVAKPSISTVTIKRKRDGHHLCKKHGWVKEIEGSHIQCRECYREAGP